MGQHVSFAAALRRRVPKARNIVGAGRRRSCGHACCDKRRDYESLREACQSHESPALQKTGARELPRTSCLALLAGVWRRPLGAGRLRHHPRADRPDLSRSPARRARPLALLSLRAASRPQAGCLSHVALRSAGDRGDDFSKGLRPVGAGHSTAAQCEAHAAHGHVSMSGRLECDRSTLAADERCCKT
jgi:hypothetical protein